MELASLSGADLGLQTPRCSRLATYATVIYITEEQSPAWECSHRGAIVSQAAYKNLVLQRLDPEVIKRLELQPVDLPVNREIELPGNYIKHLFFIEDGVASMTTSFGDGTQVEVAFAGRESILGASSMMGTKKSLNRVYMQITGHGFISRTEIATREFKQGGSFHDLTLRYLQAQFIQSAQTAGCNARHNLEQRFSRWLLLCADRVEAKSFRLSHEFIADMLGVARPSVSIVAHTFQEKCLISYKHANLEVVDRAGLERLACECYGVVRDHLNNFADTDEGFGV